MKITKLKQRNKAVCPPVVQGCVCEEIQDQYSISFSIDAANPRAYLFCLWNLGDDTIEVCRHTTCPDDWKSHMACGCPLLLSDATPDYVFYLPGHYWLKTLSGDPFPDDFAYEKQPISREVATLYFTEKGACCCG